MKSQRIRETFLDYFEKNNHKIIKSSSLQPKDDPTILFTNAGMNQFKDIFLGFEKTSYSRAASVQKCMRVSGKHNDLEQVGKTNKHHTFFEMLGNFSFGDYFKKEAIIFAWELIHKVFGLPEERLYITVYENDDEAFNLWNKHIGIPSEKIFRFGKKDNYWAMGDIGPCGPCSEIHFDLDPSLGEGPPYDLIESGSDRFLELWNLVFMQFTQDEKGKTSPLPSPSIDTGMGLERMAMTLQEKTSSYETDLFAPLVRSILDISRREYPSSDKEKDWSVRVIADHIRAITFLIGDGIMPSNDGRGYVLRRLIRRAFRNGNKLGVDEPFLYILVGVVSDTMKDTYPELLSSVTHISQVCRSEEKRFAMTLSSGMRTFESYVREIKKRGENVLSGEHVFKLYDTFGFPPDLSQELAEEKKMAIDEEGFKRELEKQKKRARSAWKGDAEQQKKKVYEKLAAVATDYIGYENTSLSDAKVIGIIAGDRIGESVKEGEAAEIVLDRTPFYAEAGGQVGDRGILKNPHFSAVIENTWLPIPGVVAHKIRVLSGKVDIGDAVEASIDESRRKSISSNHTATHLLHASLRQILGDHVKQAGSLVSPERLRFDFTHFAPLNSPEINRIEELINEKIRDDLPVTSEITTLEEGIKKGAVAIFEEKYGEQVRMITVEGFSKELCGGVHVHSTGEIGFFKIISESSIAAGMRRIEAVTGESALKYVQETEEILEDLQKMVNVSRGELAGQIEKMKNSLKEQEKLVKSFRRKLANAQYHKKTEQVKKVNGISILVQKVEGLNPTEMRELADSLRQKIGSGIVVLGAAYEKKVNLIAAVTADLVEKIRADHFIKELAQEVGGGGGGRADFAQAGGSKLDKLDMALKKSYEILEKISA
ncbi:MAG: alanine--tRNA ligase [Candidatus Aminicenantes bacterium]|nr:alanine--tRNA ligase [Candidatus Aminicenantes bacterium]